MEECRTLTGRQFSTGATGSFLNRPWPESMASCFRRGRAGSRCSARHGRFWHSRRASD
jgi:hypothetical protein